MKKHVAGLILTCCVPVFLLGGCCRLCHRERAVKEQAETRADQAQAAAVAAHKEVIIDSEGPAADLERKGDWPPGLGGSDWKDGCLFAFKGNGECKFIWRPDLPADGHYRVSIWFGGDPNSDHATNSPFTVVYDGGREKHEIDQTRDSGGWKVLGTYPFQAGRAGCVELTNEANGNVVADAVRFESLR